MYVLELKNKLGSLNKIESFVEEICDGLNIGETFLGNILISITELVNIVESQNSGVKISFKSEQKKFSFVFQEFSREFNFAYFDNSSVKNTYKNTEMEDSILMINALCDDLYFDKENRSIILTFINAGVDEIVSKHRKQYLSKFLNQRIKA